jgi:hypothetical protein
MLRVCALTIAITIPYIAAQVPRSPSAANRFYAIERLDRPNSVLFAAFGEDDRRGLLACRDAATALLKGIQAGSDVRPYLTPELLRRYPKITDLGAKVIAPETVLLAVGVSEFEFSDTAEIRLRIFAFVKTEDQKAVSELSIYCRNSANRWRVSRFE